MRKRMITILSLVVLVLAACGQTKGKKQEDNKLVSLEQVRSELDTTMKKAKAGGYNKLTFAEFMPIVTEEDVITDVKELWSQAGMEKKTIEESLKEQYQWICEFKGEKVDNSKIKDLKSGLTMDEVEKRLKKGTYPQEARLDEGYILPTLVYHLYDKDGYDKEMIEVDSGKCNVYAQFGMVAYSEELDFVKEYRANVTDESLNDSYELEDGPCTVKEAVAWAEKYENEGKPIKPGKDIVISSPTVKVFKRKNGKYAYYVGLRRSYKGITFQCAFQGTAHDTIKYDFDMGELVMVNRKLPDMMEGLGANEIFTSEGETYDKIITLDRAFTILDDRIGQNTKCEVKSAELSYCMYPEEDEEISEEYGYCDICHGKAAWKIEVENKTDEMLTIFYIGVTDYEGKNLEKVSFR